MPRRKRMYLPGHAYHLVQRGNNREVCFVEPENYQFYIELWKECTIRYGVRYLFARMRERRQGLSYVIKLC